ncbi:hypothetical protein KEM54_000354 [Ascosphaera aggregata]|nr:hypothetical protein KEM54_000354 [Ascosphaera aggregata]
MSTDPVPPAPPVLSAKQKKRNRKKAAKAAKANGATSTDHNAPLGSVDSDGDDYPAPRQAADADELPVDEEHKPTDSLIDADPLNVGAEDLTTAIMPTTTTATNTEDDTITNAAAENDAPATIPPSTTSAESGPSFDALVRDRDSLRAEVTELRKSLEAIQAKTNDEREELQRTLEVVRGEKETAEHRFRDLLGKVNTIKSQLGERLKADAEEITQCRQRIEELEEQNTALSRDADVKAEKIAQLTRLNEDREREISEIRSRTALTQQNWLEEKEELLEHTKYLQNEFEEAKQAMHNWEILATEERTIRENLSEKVLDVEEQLHAVRADYEKAAADCEAQSLTVERLQKGIDEIQKARKQELRELAESSDSQIEELKKNIRRAEEEAAQANEKLAATKNELQRALPFEKEVREKNLLIGKLRHEAVTLNEHLTKALKFLKKGRVEDNVDRHLVTNYLLQFLSLDRSDPKKFQVLQLIGALLGWGDAYERTENNSEEKEQAGLARPGSTTHASSSSSSSSPLSAFGALRSPTSAMFRNTSTPSLPADYLAASSSSPTTATSAASRKDSLAELWNNFLEQEAHSNSEKLAEKLPDSKSPPLS